MAAEGISDVGSLLAFVPMVDQLNISVDLIAADRAVLTLPDDDRFHDQHGCLHRGALFTLAETAAGILLFTNFTQWLDRATPLVTQATVRYAAPASGMLTAASKMRRSRESIIAELEAGRRPEWTINVDAADASGTQVATVDAAMTLRINSPMQSSLSTSSSDS